MNATDARELLKSAAATEVGREVLRDLGFVAVIDAPDKGDDASTIKVAKAFVAEMDRRYPFNS